jgi:hypothetical protein
MSKTSSKPERIPAYCVREYEVNGEKKSEWIRIGVNFPHRDGKGGELVLDCIPLNGRIVYRKSKPKPEEA